MVDMTSDNPFLDAWKATEQLKAIEPKGVVVGQLPLDESYARASLPDDPTWIDAWKADPRDLAVPLIWADALEESGDERGYLLRAILAALSTVRYRPRVDPPPEWEDGRMLDLLAPEWQSVLAVCCAARVALWMENKEHAFNCLRVLIESMEEPKRPRVEDWYPRSVKKPYLFQTAAVDHAVLARWNPYDMPSACHSAMMHARLSCAARRMPALDKAHATAREILRRWAEDRWQFWFFKGLVNLVGQANRPTGDRLEFDYHGIDVAVPIERYYSRIGKPITIHTFHISSRIIPESKQNCTAVINGESRKLWITTVGIQLTDRYYVNAVDDAEAVE